MPVIYKPFLEKVGGEESASTYVGNEGELFYDPATTTLRISDGETPGGSVVSGGGGSQGNALVNGEASLSLASNGVLTLPQGSLIGEMLVTDNPTVVIQPANPEHESQLLYVKGGVPGFSNSENGITVSIENTLSYQSGDIVYINVYSGLPEGTTLYWWVDQYSPGQEFQPDNGVLTLDQFGGASFDFTVLDSSIPFRVYVADQLYNAYSNNLGAVSLEMNAGGNDVDTSVHLHLTTGDLTETSIFLGTDNHNVRTKANGSIELTSYNYDSENAYRLNFNENVLRIDSDNNPGDEDLYIKAGDDLYLDAINDDIHIRAEDDVRIRTGYNFADDIYEWQFLFNSTGVIDFYNYNEGYEYGSIRPTSNNGDRGLKLESPGSTFIASEDGNRSWKFDTSGHIVFPDDTVQTTAWAGNISLSTIPASSVGQAGDLAGMVAADANHFYTCTQNFVDPNNWTAIPTSNKIDVQDGGYSFQCDVSDPQLLVNNLRVTFMVANSAWTDYQLVTSYELISGNTYRFYFAPGVSGSSQDSELQYSLTSLPHIWKRVAWSNDTW